MSIPAPRHFQMEADVFALSAVQALYTVFRIDFRAGFEIHRAEFLAFPTIDTVRRVLERNNRILVEETVYAAQRADRPAEGAFDE